MARSVAARVETSHDGSDERPVWLASTYSFQQHRVLTLDCTKCCFF